jgi:hypothetical protein
MLGVNETRDDCMLNMQTKKYNDAGDSEVNRRVNMYRSRVRRIVLATT